jgi:uncharacterized repeat protein (TIGR01451 family)
MTYVPVGSGGTGWSCSNVDQAVTCDYAPALIAGGTTPTLTINVSIDPSKQGEVTNTATVESILGDSNPPNDSDSDTTTIAAEADLIATKTPQGSLTAGGDVTYRFEVTNDGGPSTANDVTIADDLQGHYTYQGFNTVSGGTWDCSEASDTVTCDLSTPLVAGGTAIVDVILKVAEDAPNPLENTAAVTFNGTDPTPANPSDSSPVTYSADLEVDISREEKVYRSGDTINYIYTITNHGPSAATDAVLTSTIASGITVKNVSATAPDGDSILAKIDSFLFPSASAATNPFTCSLNGQQLTCNASTLYVGTYTIYVSGVINSGFTGQLVTTANITSATFDPNLNDDNAIDTIQEVLAALGLAGTGQSLLVWGAVVAVLFTVAAMLFFKVRRHNQTSS